MSNTDIILGAIKEANIQLRNMEVMTEGRDLGVKDARIYADYFAYMVEKATMLSGKCVEALVKDATRTLTVQGWEVVAPKKVTETPDLGTAIALLVRNGYKVTDPNGGNC